jgi:hypothetical protein
MGMYGKYSLVSVVWLSFLTLWARLKVSKDIMMSYIGYFVPWVRGVLVTCDKGIL